MLRTPFPNVPLVRVKAGQVAPLRRASNTRFACAINKDSARTATAAIFTACRSRTAPLVVESIHFPTRQHFSPGHHFSDQRKSTEVVHDVPLCVPAQHLRT